jgi:type IV pilus assembly protein PilY1
MMPGASGVGAVVIGNGVNSNVDRAYLLILNAETGALIRACLPGNTTDNPYGNGMSSVTYVSTSTGNKMDYIYAADYNGNIWRMDTNDSSSTCGAIKVFTAKSATGAVQPITGELTVIKAPDNKPGYMVLFGTGKYSGSNDPTDTSIQTLYGVWDNTDASVSGILRTNLVNYPIGNLNTSNKTRSVETLDNVNGGKPWYDSSSSTKKGWFIDLSCGGNTLCSGERYLDKPLVVGTSPNQIAYFLSFVPGADVCQVGGGGWVTGVNPETGAYTKTFSSIDPDSAYVGGATPRGLFIVTKEGTNGSSGSEYLYVTRNATTGANDSDYSPAFGEVKGGTTTGSDGSSTSSIGTGIPCTSCVPSTAGARRQVWRQIQ